MYLIDYNGPQPPSPDIFKSDQSIAEKVITDNHDSFKLKNCLLLPKMSFKIKK